MADNGDHQMHGNTLLATDTGEKRLNELGYRQALKRDLSNVMNYCFAMSLLATPLTITSLYTVGFYSGGPVVIVWGWLLVSFFSMFVVVSMAEILSSLPTAGGIYYQAFYLGGETWGPLACWWTGWLDWAAYVSGIAAVNYIFAQFISLMILLATDGSYVASRTVNFGISSAAAGIEVIFNLSPIRIMGLIESVGAMWTIGLSFLLIFLIPAVAPTHQSASYVFTTFIDNSSESGLGSPVYLFCLGLLMTQFSLTGFDVNGHISEETKNSDISAAWGTILSVVSAIVLGFALLLAITFSIQDPSTVLDPNNATLGSSAAPQVYYDVFFARYGSGNGAIVLIGLVALCGLFGNTGGTAAGSRLLWAMSRDGAVPFSSFFSYLTPDKVPIPAMLLTSLASIAFTLPVIWSAVAYNAINSFTTIGTYLAYGIPILMKVTLGLNRFEPGPLSLGVFSIPVNIVALLWIVFIGVVFSLPTSYPITEDTLNYAPIAFGVIFVLISLPWFLPKTLFNFRGPVGNFEEGAETTKYLAKEEEE